MPAPTNGRVAHSPSGPSLSPNTSVSNASNLFAKTQEATESVWIAIGRAAEAMGDLDRALGAYERALATNSQSWLGLTMAAHVCRCKEDYSRAVEYFRRALQINNADGDLWGSLGHCYLMQDELQAAYQAYQNALYHLPGAKEDPKLWYGIGILYDRYGSLDHAEEAFSSVLRMDKNFEKIDEIHFRLGIIYKQLQRYTESLQCFDRILRNPPHPLSQMDIWFQIGHVYEQQKEYERAKDAWERVLKDAPDHAKVLQQLGWLFHQANAQFCNQDLAVQYLTKSIESDASDAQSWYLLGRAYMTQQKYNKAYEAYQQAVYRDGRNPTFWISIGVLYFQINQYKDALDAYTRAIRLNPYISEVWFDLGSLYESCNRQLQDAVDAYLRAKELDPSNTVVVERLEILRRYEEDPSIIIPPAPAPRDVHPTAYSGPTQRNEPPPPMRTSPPQNSFNSLGGPGYGPGGRSMSRPTSSSGRYRNGSLGPPADRSRGQGDIALADARDRDRAYAQNGRERPGSDLHHGGPIHSAYLNAPSNQAPLPPVMHGGQPQGGPPPPVSSSSSSHRRHGHGSARRTSPQRSVSPVGPPAYGRGGPPRGGSPLPSVSGLGLHGPPHSQVSHPSSSAAGGHYNSYAPPPSRYNGMDRPRSPGSSARGGTYGGMPPAGPQVTPGSDSNEMVWERERPYSGHPRPPPPDSRDFIDRDRDMREQRIHVKEEPREQRAVRTGPPPLPPPTPSHMNGAPRHYPHERNPSDDFEMRPPQTPNYGYPPQHGEWERSASRGGARSPMPPPSSQPTRYEGKGRYDPLQEDRVPHPPPNRYSSPSGYPHSQPPPSHHSPVGPYEERDVHSRGRQEPPQVQLQPQEAAPPPERRRRRDNKAETASSNGKDSTPAPKRRGGGRSKRDKDHPTPTPTPVQPTAASAPGTSSSSPTGYRGSDVYEGRGRQDPQQYTSRYPESERRGPPPAEQPTAPRVAIPRVVDDDYDANGAADALIGLAGGARSAPKPPSSASQTARPSSRRDSDARTHTPTPPGGSKKRRRSGSVESYETASRAPAEPVERMEPERKKPRLDDETGAPSQANGASSGRTFSLPSMRTRGSMDDILMDSPKKESPKHSAPNSAVSMEAPAPPAPASSQNGRGSSPMAVDHVPRTESPTRISPNATPGNGEAPKKSPTTSEQQEGGRPRPSTENSPPDKRRKLSYGTAAPPATNGTPASAAPLVSHSPSSTSRSGSVAASTTGTAPQA